MVLKIPPRTGPTIPPPALVTVSPATLPSFVLGPVGQETNPFVQPSPKWVPPSTTKPAYGGLHQLAMYELMGKSSPATIDFSTYVPGKNNRGLYEGILRELNAQFGTTYTSRYTSGGTEVFEGKVSIDEKAMDALLAPLGSAEERRSMATFVLAHEHAHLLLKHLDGLDGTQPYKVQLRNEYRRVIEMQADYLAAKYLHTKGLSTAPVVALFESAEMAKGNQDYPPGAIRKAAVESAREPGIRTDLFQNDVLDCLAFLDSLAKL